MEIQTKINSLNALLPQQVPFVMAQISKALEIAEQSENFERNLDVAIAIAEQVSKFSGGDMLYNYTPILLALLKDSPDEATLAPFDTINHDVPIGIALVKQFLGTYSKRTKYAAGDLVNAQKNDNVCMVILANLLADIKAGNNALNIAYIITCLNISRVQFTNGTYKFFCDILLEINNQEF